MPVLGCWISEGRLEKTAEEGVMALTEVFVMGLLAESFADCLDRDIAFFE